MSAPPRRSTKPRKQSSPGRKTSSTGGKASSSGRKKSSTGRKKSAPSRKETAAPADRAPDLQRLQVVLAAAGVGSRRQCEELIEAGRVEVDRRVVTRLGTKVDSQRQAIHLDGQSLKPRRRVHYVVHKPPGVVSTHRDPGGRPRVVDLVPDRGQRLFTVGRLDMSSEGLILVTNDGQLANRLAHPRYEVSKTYRVVVAGQPSREVLAKIRHGVRLAEGIFRIAGVRVKSRRKQSTLLEIELREGRNREIRRVLARVGHKVQRLTRIALGPLRLGELPQGAYRPLTRDELRALKAAATTPRREANQKKTGR